MFLLLALIVVDNKPCKGPVQYFRDLIIRKWTHRGTQTFQLLTSALDIIHVVRFHCAHQECHVVVLAFFIINTTLLDHIQETITRRDRYHAHGRSEHDGRGWMIL